MSGTNSNEPTIARRWLPNEEAVFKRWHNSIGEEREKRHGAKRHVVIQEFEQMIDEDPVVQMYLKEMIKQIPEKYCQHHPKNLQEFLDQLNAVLTIAPHYVPPGHTEATALGGTPFSAILIWTMGTPAGFAAYWNPTINTMFKNLFCVWAGFLTRRESLYVLTDEKKKLKQATGTPRISYEHQLPWGKQVP